MGRPTRTADEPGFPNRIAEFRATHPGMTQKELGRLVGGQHFTRVSDDERGRFDLKQSRVAAYAEALGVRPYELIVSPDEAADIKLGLRIVEALRGTGLNLDSIAGSEWIIAEMAALTLSKARESQLDASENTNRRRARLPNDY